MEHDAEILRVAILAQPKRELFRVEVVVEIRKNGRIQILGLVNGFEDF